MQLGRLHHWISLKDLPACLDSAQGLRTVDGGETYLGVEETMASMENDNF